REIAEKNDLEQVLKTFANKVAVTIDGDAVVITRDTGTKDVKSFSSANGQSLISEIESAVAQWVQEHGEPADPKLAMFAGERSLFYFPVKAEEKTLAVLGIRLRERDMKLSRDQRQLIETFTNLAAVAIARLQAAKDAEQAKWLAESEKLHRTLLNSISHDFRTPLASITGAVTSLLTEDVAYSGETKKIFLETIKEEAQRMNRFIENLLDMARLESGTLRPNMKWCDVQDIIGVALRETGDVLTGHPIWVDVPREPVTIMADFILIKQVLINLLENAAKYSPTSEAISVSAYAREDAVVISVSDLGTYIPKSEQEHIFDKFHRLHSSQQTSGTGLGLSICKGIVEAHGGRIWLESSAEHGNRFIFKVPVSEETPTQQTGTKGQTNVG
ncbi:MAG TPA: ATP-binding protein, partial [Syntrophorhabdaceae bacterium]|nr:ATP-binding protein [Syntrophorhabdaceae bacterium]